jgi:hypothetical protein
MTAMDEPIINHIELSYLEDGTVTVSSNLVSPEGSRPTLSVTIVYPSTEMTAAVLEVRDQLRPHLLAAARAAIPPELDPR